MKRTIQLLIFALFCVILFVGCQQEQATKEYNDFQGTQTDLSEKELINVSIPASSVDEDSENEYLDAETGGEVTEEEQGITVPEPNSYQVVVNKERRLPDGYTPPDLTIADVPYHVVSEERKYLRASAASALEELFEEASTEGHELVAISGYRSYDTQVAIYTSNVASRGQEYTDRYSAQPGFSEHQTGLAMDVSTASMGYALEEAFGETSEGQWIAENAHRFGFIIRYPEDASHITGYNYEPWHLRYVGKEVSQEIFEQDITLEEYFGLN